MRHPSEGVLRRLIDEPAGVAEPDRQHVANCQACLGDVATMRTDAELVQAALGAGSDTEVDVATAWQRLSATATSAAATTATAVDRGRTGVPRSRRSRALLRRPVAAAVAFTVVLGGAGAAAANDWLEIFRTEQITPVSFDTSELNAVPDLSSYGDVEVTGDGDLRPVSGASEAESETDLDVPVVGALPRGVTGEPTYQVGDKVSATFTFSAERAAGAAAESGRTPPAPPAGLDGSKVRLEAGPGVAATWSQSGGIPALFVGRAVAPTAFSTGVPFETVRDYLLSVPGLPREVAATLRTFNADGSTLPLPVPEDQVTTTSSTVNGVPATVLATRDRSMAAVVWVKDGVLTVVAGALGSDEVQSVARGLR